MKKVKFLNPITQKEETIDVDVDAENIKLGFDKKGDIVYIEMLIDQIPPHQQGQKTKSVSFLNI